MKLTNHKIYIYNIHSSNKRSQLMQLLDLVGVVDCSIFLQLWVHHLSLPRRDEHNDSSLMWEKHCHKPSSWECFIPSIYGDLGDCLLLFHQHYIIYYTSAVSHMCYLTSEEGRSYAILILSYLQTLQALTTLIEINGHVRDLKLEVPT